MAEKPISQRHAQRSEAAVRLRRQFCASFAYLIRLRQRKGEDIRGCQLLAAQAVGIGEKSYSDFSRYKAQKSMSTRMLKEPNVVAELERLGLVNDKAKGGWHDPNIPHSR